MILVGTVAVTGLWWALHAVRHYPGPKVMVLYIHTDGVACETTEKGTAATVTATEVKVAEAAATLKQKQSNTMS